jgi:hypothetical protein
MNTGFTCFYMVLILLFFIHFVADFVGQSQEIATRKSHSINAMLYHIMTYSFITFGLIQFIYIIDLITNNTMYVFTSFIIILKYTCIIGLLHGLTDIFTSKIAKHFYNQNNLHAFFVTIGFDQFIHYTSIILTLIYMIFYK